MKCFRNCHPVEQDQQAQRNGGCGWVSVPLPPALPQPHDEENTRIAQARLEGKTLLLLAVGRLTNVERLCFFGLTCLFSVLCCV